MVPGTSRYLYDYAEAMRSEILDLLTLGLGLGRRSEVTRRDPRQQCSTAASNGGKSRPVTGGHRAKVCSKLRSIHPGAAGPMARATMACAFLQHSFINYTKLH